MSEPIVHRQVALLRVSDPRVFDEIRAVLPLDDFAIAVVSDTEIAVDPACIGELSSRLGERGLAPLMKRAPEAEERVHGWDETTRPVMRPPTPGPRRS